MGGLLPNTNITTSNEPTPPTSTVFIWNGTGAWPTTLTNWNNGSAPSSSINSVIIQTGTATFNLPTTTISFLTVDPGAALDIVGGLLNTAGLIDNGTINVDGDPPALVITGPATIGSGGTLTAQDGSATFTNGGLLNAGALTAGPGGTVLINESGINSGLIWATGGGVVTIENGEIVNSVTDGQGHFTDGTVLVDAQSKLVLENASILQGIVHVGPGGEIDTVSGSNNTINTANGPTHNATVPSLIIDEGGSIVVNDSSSLALASSYNIENSGTIELKSTVHATILYFNQLDAVLAGGGKIVLDGGSGSLDIIAGLPGQDFATINLDNHGNTIEGAGAIGQNDGALSFTNDESSVIDANLNGQTLYIETGDLLTNNALMRATKGGILDVLDDVAGDGHVAIAGGGTAVFAGAFSQDVAFSGTGTLELAHSLGGAYGGIITGFGAGDAIILDDVAFSKGEYAIWCNGKLTIYDCGAALETIALSGNYERNSFAVIDDGGKAEVAFVGDEWIGPSSEDRTGTWTTDANWTLGLPTSKLNAIVDLPGDYTITTSGDQVANSLTITDVDATLKGSGSLTLGTLENHGTIDAHSCEQTLTLDTGCNQITNAGSLAADNGGILDVESSVNNAGGLIKVSDDGFADFEKSVTGGTAIVQGGKLEFDAASSVDVTFDNRGGHYGELILGNVKGFSGTIFGFNGQGSECPSLLTSDEIDLRCVAVRNVCFSEDANDAIITVMNNAHTVLATITIDNFDFRNLEKASDGHGGTIIFDPPASGGSGPSVSIGGAGNDTFAFHPGEGTQTVNNFNPQHDTIELDHFANVQNVQELAAAITPDVHGNAVLELGHGDSIAIPGVSATFLQQNLQSLVHLHA